MSSARLVGKGNTSVTPLYSRYFIGHEGETEGFGNELGLQVTQGLSEKWDLKMRLGYIAGTEDISDGFFVIGFAPKVSLIKNIIAFSLPIGIGFDGDGHSFQSQPTFNFTYPAIANKLEFTLSPKYVMTLDKDVDIYDSGIIAVNIGMAISKDLNKWAIYPEFGIGFHPEGEGYVGQFGIAMSYTFSK